MLKKIRVEDAVGTRLAHDITEIRPGEFKGPAFRKGHEVCNEDICHLQKIGKNQLYLIDMDDDEIHENQAAAILAAGLAGATCGTAAVVLDSTGSYLGATSLEFLALRFPGSDVGLGPLARLLGEAEPGVWTHTLIGGSEGFLFAFGLVLGLTRRPR